MNISTLYGFIYDKKTRFSILEHMGFYHILSDKNYLRKSFKVRTGCDLNLDHPQTFNEKLQWLKLNDRNPLYTVMVDKYKVKDYVYKKIGKEHIIPTIGVWNHPDEIDFHSLPDQFVLKCNHNSGGLYICRDKAKFDTNSVKKGLATALKHNYYFQGREWPYKDVPRKILAEKYMTDESGVELKDYKIFCFSGQPKFIQVDFNRFAVHKRNLYTLDWQYIDAEIQFPSDRNIIIEKPEKLDEMINIAKILSDGLPHVRVDLYSVRDKVFFGELTFYHGSGFEKFSPENFGYTVGKWLRIE